MTFIFLRTFDTIASPIRTVCKYYQYTLNELIAKKVPLMIHQRSFQNLVTGVFKVKIGVPSELLKDVVGIIDIYCNDRNETKGHTFLKMSIQ